jgi:hypothetical protein
MGTGAAIIALANVTSSLLILAQNAQAISQLIQKAESEGRNTLTTDEWAVVTGADDHARQVLADAISKALAAPPK